MRPHPIIRPGSPPGWQSDTSGPACLYGSFSSSFTEHLMLSLTNMKTAHMSRFALMVLLLAPAIGCSPDHPARTASERHLLHVWSAPGSSVEERAEAVNRCFPPGIPLSSIMALLGTNHAELRLVAIANSGKSFEGRFTLTYGFGDEEAVTIQASGPTNANPLGAGFSDAKGWTRRSGSARTPTNSPGEGQPAGAADGSEPLSVETNGKSGAAGSRR